MSEPPQEPPDDGVRSDHEQEGVGDGEGHPQGHDDRHDREDIVDGEPVGDTAPGSSVAKRGQEPRRVDQAVGSQGTLPGLEQFGVIERFESFTGPVPPPAMLQAYEDIHPGLADRLVGMAERSLDGQLEIDRMDKRAESRALVAAAYGVTFFPWLAVICAVVLALAGLPYLALVTGAAGLLIAGPQVIAAIRRSTDTKAGAGDAPAIDHTDDQSAARDPSE